MAEYKNIQTTLEDGVFTLTLAREHKRNAIDEQTMDELLDALQHFSTGEETIMAVLQARGKDFSAGADLDWMRNTQQMEVEAIQQQNMKLHNVFQLWYDLPVFTVANLTGNVVGGAIGLAAASDLVIAHPVAKFRFSEVSLGLIPAIIAPFVLKRTQSRFVKNAMLTAIPFTAQQAYESRLVDWVADEASAPEILNKYREALQNNEPYAVGAAKKLINDLQDNRIQGPMDVYTTRLLAEVRKSEAASKRISQFFKSVKSNHENK